MPLKLKFNLSTKRKLKKIQFDIHIAEHCNLNCKGCSHFSPLAERDFISIEEFERDIKRMGILFDHECGKIWLLGGEPLLHPEINTLMKIARENFSNGIIGITTNGTLLARKEDDFWTACRDYEIYIRISHYPIDINAEKIKEQAKKFDVKCFWDEGDLKNEFLVFPIDLEGREDFKKNFAICSFANHCLSLSHGKLYPCVFPAHVELFNKKFNQNVIITEKDYIDIYKENNKYAVFKKLSEPIPACRYCKVAARRPTKWEMSKRDINEWL